MPLSVDSNRCHAAFPLNRVEENSETNTPPSERRIIAVLQKKFGECLTLHGFPEYSEPRHRFAAFPCHVPAGHTRLILEDEDHCPVLRVTTNLHGVMPMSMFH